GFAIFPGPIRERDPRLEAFHPSAATGWSADRACACIPARPAGHGQAGGSGRTGAQRRGDQRVPPRQRPYGETGMAHLLEHLVFKATPTHPDIHGALRNRGIDFNGTTSLDRTNYFASFVSNPDTLEWLLRIEADRMVNSRISGEDLASEMTVVRNEMEIGE